MKSDALNRREEFDIQGAAFQSLPYEKKKAKFKTAFIYNASSENSLFKVGKKKGRTESRLSKKIRKLINDEKSTYLHIIAVFGRIEELKNILEKKEISIEEINKLNSEGDSALKLAVNTNREEIVELLLENGATYVEKEESSSLYNMLYNGDHIIIQCEIKESIKYMLFTHLADSSGKKILTEYLCGLAAKELTGDSFKKFVAGPLFQNFISEPEISGSRLEKILTARPAPTFQNFKYLFAQFNHLLQENSWKGLIDSLCMQIPLAYSIAYEVLLKCPLNRDRLVDPTDSPSNELFNLFLLKAIQYALKENEIDLAEKLIKNNKFEEDFSLKIVGELDVFLKKYQKEKSIELIGTLCDDLRNYSKRDLKSLLERLVMPVAIMFSENKKKAEYKRNHQFKDFYDPLDDDAAFEIEEFDEEENSEEFGANCTEGTSGQQNNLI